MDRRMSSAITGVAVSAAVGAAAYMLSNKGTRARTKMMKKNAGKAIRAVGSIIDNVSTFVR